MRIMSFVFSRVVEWFVSPCGQHGGLLR